MMRIGKKYSLSEIRSKILNYCAKQERCHSDVRRKLLDYGTDYSSVDELISYLIEHGFLNESRFANLYCRSKFNQNSWGWNKIKKGLIEKKISEPCIAIAKKEIDETEYRTQAVLLIEKKLNSYSIGNIFEKRQKVLNYMLQKGYEYKLVQEIIFKKND